MHASDRSIFRESAIKHYIQNRERDVLLRILPLPTAVFLWILIGVLLAAGVFAWNERIPTYVSGTGTVLADTGGGSVAVVFLPPEQSPTLHAGESVQVHIGSAGPQVQSKILEVEPDITSPATARKNYQLSGDSSSLITQPSIVIVVKLGTEVPARMYAGSSLTADVEVGSHRILSLLPWIGKLVGE
jgi:hypothetical protein